MKKFFDCGIDLGTTNSCIAKPNYDNTCVIIENSEGGSVTPSVVSINKAGRLTVGARANRISNPADVKKEFKRDMGTDTVYTFKSSGKEKTPIDLSAEILGQLKRDFEARYINKLVKDVIITVPAAFSLMQCEATKKAGIAAGFRNIILLQEPIAAAIAYGAQPDSKEQYWLVFDYGGGTLDVSVISTKDDHLDNVNSRGDNHMGGKDLDRILYEKIILPKIQEEYNLPKGFDEITTKRIMIDVEACKKELSLKTEIEFFPDNLGEVCDEDGEYIDFSCEITRDEFEAAIREVVLNAVSIARKALDESGIPENKVDRILLVGGSTFVPLVRNELKREFSIELDCSLNPMTVVAEGAALFAASQYIEEVAESSPVENEYVLDYEYNAISSLDIENVCGTITGPSGTVSKVKIDCIADENSVNALWSSGWSDVLDPVSGAFDIDVKICNQNASNLYKITATDSANREITLCGYLFEIIHKESALKVLAPPMPHAIGVLANDGKMNRISWFSEKNTKLPINKTCTFTLDKSLDPSMDDSCTFMFYEGEVENACNPKSNQLVGKVVVLSKSFPRKINKGTEIEITLDIDISRSASVSAYLPDLGIEMFRNKELQDLGGEVNVMLSMTELEGEIESTQYTLDNLRKKHVNVDALFSRFITLRDDYDRYLDLVGVNNDSVLVYIQSFHSLQTEIIQFEMSNMEDIENKDANSEIERAERNINHYGSDQHQAQLQQYRQQMGRMRDQDSKRFLENKINELENQVLSNSLEWLTNVYIQMYELRPVSFTNNQRAEYWKSHARSAINKKDPDGLRKAIIELQDLRISSVGETANQSLADLRLL